MQINTLGSFGPVSRLTLGGGGIDLIDAAPGYKICEAMIGRAFEGRLPPGIRITTQECEQMAAIEALGLR